MAVAVKYETMEGDFFISLFDSEEDACDFATVRREKGFYCSFPVEVNSMAEARQLFFGG